MIQAVALSRTLSTKTQNHQFNMISEPRTTLHISSEDHQVLKLLLAASPKTATLDALRAELARATILPGVLLPKDVVRLHVPVRYEDLSTGEQETYTITLPPQADIDRGRISVFSPIGTALLGYRQGDEIFWATPGGTRHLRVVEVGTARGE